MGSPDYLHGYIEKLLLDNSGPLSNVRLNHPIQFAAGMVTSTEVAWRVREWSEQWWDCAVKYPAPWGTELTPTQPAIVTPSVLSGFPYHWFLYF